MGAVMLRLIFNLLAILAVMLGVVWILQGFNLFPVRSLMNGNHKWALYGVCIAMGGLVLMGFANRLGPRRDH